MSMDTGPSLMERYTGMDWETPLPGSKMYHAAPAPGGGSSANPPVLEARLAPDPETRVSRLPQGVKNSIATGAR